MTALTASAKKRITEDWRACLPMMGVYKPMWLIKRNGPLLMGVLLERTRANDVYVPMFHVHCLLVPSSVLTLSMPYPVPRHQVPTLRTEIKVSRHESDFAVVAESLKKLVPEIMQTNITLSRVLEMHREFLEQGQTRDPVTSRYCAGVFLDVVLLSWWGGYKDYALQCIREATPIFESWGDLAICQPPWPKIVEDHLDHARMEATIAEEIVKHKLAHLPVYDLVANEPPKPNITETYESINWD